LIALNQGWGVQAGDAAAGTVHRMTDLPSDAPALIVAEVLIGLRRRIAPPGSLRERVLRVMYMPLILYLRRRRTRARFGTVPTPVVVHWEGAGGRAEKLPAHPRILVLKLDHIGDFVVALPAFEHLRSVFPDAAITLVCASWNRAWAEALGLFDTVVSFDFFTTTNAEWRGATEKQFDAFAALPLTHYDLAIDLRHDPDTRPLLARVDATFRAGFYALPQFGGGGKLDIELPDMEHISSAAGRGRPVHAELRLLLLANAVTATFRPAPHPAPRLRQPAAHPTPVTRPYAILAPGAGSPIRVWPVDRLTAVGRALHERHGLDLMVTGAAAQRADCEAIVRALPAGAAQNLAGRVPLAELPRLVRGAQIYVGYDTGTTHLAAALGVPTVAIISGVPDLDVWCTKGERTIVVAGRMPCSPCYLVHAEQCPYGVPCLTAVSVDHVVAACDKVLALTGLPACDASDRIAADGVRPADPAVLAP
jgi:ADP-heptose:LPS heptosyltransferase